MFTPESISLLSTWLNTLFPHVSAQLSIKTIKKRNQFKFLFWRLDAGLDLMRRKHLHKPVEPVNIVINCWSDPHVITKGMISILEAN